MSGRGGERPDLSVAVVTWNSADHIEDCLRAVERSVAALPEGGRPLATEILVVDNASSDDTAQRVSARYPHVLLLRNGENVGFPRAVNQVLPRARGRYCLLLNPDAEVVGDALPVMVRFMDARPEAGIAGCRVENPDGTLQRGCRRMLPSPRRMLFRLLGLHLLFPRVRWISEYTMAFLPEDETHPVEAVSGSFLLIRRETMERIGPMDERFFMYGEDLDWCARAAEAGWRVFYHPGARVIHHLGRSSRQARRRTTRELHRAGAIYYRKHLAGRSPFLVNALVLAALRARCALALLGIAASEAWRPAGGR